MLATSPALCLPGFPVCVYGHLWASGGPMLEEVSTPIAPRGLRLVPAVPVRVPPWGEVGDYALYVPPEIFLGYFHRDPTGFPTVVTPRKPRAKHQGDRWASLFIACATCLSLSLPVRRLRYLFIAHAR